MDSHVLRLTLLHYLMTVISVTYQLEDNYLTSVKFICEIQIRNVSQLGVGVGRLSEKLYLIICAKD